MTKLHYECRNFDWAMPNKIEKEVNEKDFDFDFNSLEAPQVRNMPYKLYKTHKRFDTEAFVFYLYANGVAGNPEYILHEKLI